MEKGKNLEDPSQLIDRISALIHEIDDLEKEFLSYRRKMIIREDKIIDLVSYADNIIEKVSQLQQRMRDNLFVANK